ncbi:MAG: hypothetical protein LBO79_02760 [Zoogloeaceae bacterium]|jgi:hypothetical protein|nr:hypothetical protein [Zoogloeaceae bacterium]
MKWDFSMLKKTGGTGGTGGTTSNGAAFAVPPAPKTGGTRCNKPPANQAGADEVFHLFHLPPARGGTLEPAWIGLVPPVPPVPPEKTNVCNAQAESDEKEETVIRAWLAMIEETDPAIIAEVMSRCREDSDARAYFVGRATKVREKVRGKTIEERAAIMEFDGGLSRLEAEHAAVLDAGEAPCKVCAHFHRPGLSNGYCHMDVRPDLPPAYGENHPLRQLPDDLGADCKAFRLSCFDRRDSFSK